MRSKKELDDWLQEQWAQRSGTLADHQRVGLSVTEIVAYAEKRNSARESNLVELWVAILDELISWQSSLCTVLFHAKPFTNWYRSLLILLMKIISDAVAIRQLIIAGLNASALTLLRSTGEYIEVFVAILDEPTLADEFVKTDTLEEANRFWRSHVAKGKIAKKVYKSWESFLGAECATEIIDWCNSNNGLLAGTIHPSIAGGLFAAFPLESNREDREDDSWLAAWGTRSEDSVYIVYTYAAKMLALLLLYRDFPFDSTRGNIKYDNSDELHQHVRIGRDILSTLILSLWNSGNDAEHFPTHRSAVIFH